VVIKVGNQTFGWGADVRDLPENRDAYGPHHLTLEEQEALAVAIRAAGAEPSWRARPTEKVVFLCDEKKTWRQSLVSGRERGLTLQVKEPA
jgi:hypothetical protein